MKTAPLISVIVPVYKVEKYLEECVESILGQTYTNLEVWLVDDGSPDNCPALCDAFAQRDSRVRVIHKENGGVSSARNAALDVCTGAYITFVDGDDVLLPGACQMMLEKVRETAADLCIGGVLYLDAQGNRTEIENADVQREDVLDREGAFRRITEKPDLFFTTVWGALYRRELFQTLRMEEGRLHEDIFIMHHIFAACTRVATTAAPVYLYRIRSGSIMTSSYHIGRVRDGAAAYWDQYLFLKELGYSRYANYALRSMCGVVNTGLRQLPLKGNEEVFVPYIRRLLLLRFHDLRCVKMLLLAGKNRLTMR